MLMGNREVNTKIVVISYMDDEAIQEGTGALHDILVKITYNGDDYYIDTDSVRYSDEDVHVYTSVNHYISDMLNGCTIIDIWEE